MNTPSLGNSLAFRYGNAAPSCATEYIWPVLQKIVAREAFPDKRAFDLGCGNGAIASLLAARGFRVTGVDISQSGVALARQNIPQGKFDVGDAYDDLAAKYGRFPLVVSFEVVEHCFYPRKFAKTIYDLVAPGGVGVLSTPYHGYLKNLSLALAGRWDRHLTALWDGGHIKFFSIDTLGKLLAEAGFKDVAFIRAGRIPPLAKTMIAIARK